MSSDAAFSAPETASARTSGISLRPLLSLPDNLFYGTPIPGAIVFFNKNKPADRADKVLMIYAARRRLV